MPILFADFVGANKMLLTGRRPFFYVFDLPTGAVTRMPPPLGREEVSMELAAVSKEGGLIAVGGVNGHVTVLNAATFAAVAKFKINGNVRALSFLNKDAHLVVTGRNAPPPPLLTAEAEGLVYVFDVRAFKCVGTFVDEGALRGGAVGVSADAKFLATGYTPPLSS
jgi:U3 small nucleolar RNA-associated protein 18